MKYDFKVNPQVYKLFAEDVTDLEIKELYETFRECRISYSDKNEKTSEISILEVLEGNSDNQQIIMWGITDKGEKISVAYWLIGDDENSEEYQEGLDAFEIMQKEYMVG